MTEQKKELKPCPFCGGEADIFTSDELGYLGNDMYTVKCGNCFCGTGHYKDPIRATEAWNRRVTTGRKRIELKPCPFCGGTATMIKNECQETGYTGWFVFHNCGLMQDIRTKIKDTPERAAYDWNRRSDDE